MRDDPTDDEVDRALARMAHMLGPLFVTECEAGIIKEKNMELDDATLAAIFDKLNEVQDILIAYDKETNNTAGMEISEWNETPIGKAVYRLQSVLEMLDDVGDGS